MTPRSPEATAASSSPGSRRRNGPVSNWRPRESKGPGERILHADRNSCLFYDYAAAVKIAKRDGWDAPPYKTGTAGERAVRAVDADFKYLAEWCRGDWYWAVVTVEVSCDGVVLERDICGGIESYGDYWREHVAEVANSVIRQDKRERKNAAAKAARVTAMRQQFFFSNPIGEEI